MKRHAGDRAVTRSSNRTTHAGPGYHHPEPVTVPTAPCPRPPPRESFRPCKKPGHFLSPAQVKKLLVATGDHITHPKSSLVTPRVDLGKAFALMLPNNAATLQLLLQQEGTRRLSASLRRRRAGGGRFSGKKREKTKGPASNRAFCKEIFWGD